MPHPKNAWLRQSTLHRNPLAVGGSTACAFGHRRLQHKLSKVRSFDTACEAHPQPVGGHGTAEVKTLTAAAPQAEKCIPDRLAFDALGDGLQTKLVGEIDDGWDDNLTFSVLQHV